MCWADGLGQGCARKADLQVVQGEVEQLVLQAPHDAGGQALQGHLHVAALPSHGLQHPLEAHKHLPCTSNLSSWRASHFALAMQNLMSGSDQCQSKCFDACMQCQIRCMDCSCHSRSSIFSNNQGPQGSSQPQPAAFKLSAAALPVSPEGQAHGWEQAEGPAGGGDACWAGAWAATHR